MSKSNQKRMKWENNAEFMLSLIGYSISLGNLWRFSYLCHKNGGGAFLIPYLVGAAFITFPMYMFEIGHGQCTGKGKVKAWDRIPLMKGIGYAGIFIAVFALIPYILIMAWGIFFFGYSFSPAKLPWTTCGNKWNTENCIPQDLEGGNWTSIYSQILVNSSINLNSSMGNATYSKSSPSQVQFFRNYVLRIPDDYAISGSFNYEILICCFVCFLVINFITIKGIRTSGKAVYVTATFPFIMLFILLIRGVTLEGAGEGIKKFLLPDMTQLAKPKVWVEAASQALYSYGIGFVSLTAFGSYNQYKHDFYRQCVYIVPLGTLTSVIMGITTFSILGHMAHVLGVEIDNVVESGPGLVFQIIPFGLAAMPFPQIWSVLFFLMFFFVGIDTFFSDIEGLMAIVGDAFPKSVSSTKRRAISNSVVCFSFFVASLSQLFGHGFYIFELYNYYGASGICLLWVAMFESIAVGWLWDADNFADDVTDMAGRSYSKFFKYSYKFSIPTVTFAILVFFFIKWTPLKVGDFSYPAWVNVIGWLMSLCSMLCIPGFAIYAMCKRSGTFTERFRKSLESSGSQKLRKEEKMAEMVDFRIENGKAADEELKPMM